MILAALDVTALPSDTLLGEGRYRLETEIGRGGYGITYSARRTGSGDLVAIKECVFAGCERDQGKIVCADEDSAKFLEAWGERTLAQAERLRAVSHPHLARVFEAWRENNTVYVAMEWLEGPTLRQHLEEQGPLGMEEALKCAGELAGALAALHEHDLVHLDVKPENAVLTERGAVLLDFDLVQPCGEGDVSTRPLSLAGRIGTPGYAPPESYGERAPQGAASDVYSLGATLYFLLGATTPPSAVDRAAGIELQRLAIAPHLHDALEAALRLPIDARPISMRAFQKMWVPPPPPAVIDDDFAFSAHQANLAQSQLATGVYRVVLTHSEAEFPPRCVCCFEKADRDADILVKSPSGKRYVPGCQLCLRHQSISRASSAGTGWGVGLSVPIVSVGTFLCVTSDSILQLGMGLLLCLLALFVFFASINYGALKSSRAEEMLKSSCCHPLEPVTYSFNGRVYIWRFKNVLYAEEFKRKNAPFVV
ncbi:serine/threonine-protein kinase StkP [Abditibacteriota bacterium]|nr:serine/threonine-protein kinase StkP [Abditibacteriota bacterium]